MQRVNRREQNNLETYLNWLLFVLQPPTGSDGVMSEISDTDTRGDLKREEVREEVLIMRFITCWTS